jgi:hypothetical protein
MTKKIKVSLSWLLIGPQPPQLAPRPANSYPAGQYEGGLFENNFYTGRHDFASKTCNGIILTKTLTSDQYFNGDNAEAILGTYSNNW